MATETLSASAPPMSETFHFINNPHETISDALGLLSRLNPALHFVPEHKILCRSDLAAFAEGHVTVIGCAGGGHEPMFTGFVGHNFLSAAVSGSVFASPTGRQIYEAIKLCQSSPSSRAHGSLLVVGNYTGDILNAGLAITRATAAGYNVRLVAVGDDIAVGRKKGGKVGRRGLSGHLLGLKCACALAARGAGLDEVAVAVERVVERVGTIGCAFDRVALPNALITDLHTLAPNTIELGMGCHGEPGLSTLSLPLSPAALTEQMVSLLTDSSDSDRSFIPFNLTSRTQEVVLLLNSFGGTSNEVLGVFAELAVLELEKRNIKVVRLMLGPLVTSLKMSGLACTVWLLPDGEAQGGFGRDEALELWDAPVDVVAWRR
ncbi:hypothetical protein V502_11027 [Pseudogymnoascus sp. VKM F-4520 (FW-2644)]|nr:hypothetical protein V502_11027 [Pseudogymnoascus sp. VKM F-4520 (FW-2644)]